MWKQRAYYLIKPFLPRRFRMAARRFAANRKIKAYSSVWPVDESVGQKPAGWPGWPEGKKFAFVLTHDVEGPGGVAKCRQLAELEMQLGFRSSFNFIPEGDYAVSTELRDWLTENGFEVGVHDLNHDGKLYSSRRDFSEKADRINGYVRKWNAAGYRSGFMFHNLDWHHDLDIEYDASTFDTDPFEPQPEGVGTIFPFWVTRPGASGKNGGERRNGYVELPYTLPQDSTLFLLFRQKTAAIWLRKLHWVAGLDGMALVNIHPDYLCFAGEGPSINTYPAGLYADLLREVKETYAGQYWNPLPRKLAQWYRETVRPAPVPAVAAPPAIPDHAVAGLKGKRAAVLLYSVYPGDPRPRRAAEALADCGMEVEVLCQMNDAKALRRDRVNGVEIRRLSISRRRDGKATYLWQYSRFFLSSLWFLTWRGLRQRYDLIHVHNMPDFLVFAAVVPRLRGAKVILDLHDPMPELMTTIFGVEKESTTVKTLEMVERKSTGFAHAVITVNEACRRIFSGRSCPAGKVTVIMNSPDEHIFAYREADRRPRQAGTPFVIMYHGSIVERHGLDLAVAALEIVRRSAPDAELRIYGGRTPFLDKVMKSVEGTALAGFVHYRGSCDLEGIAQAIRESDVGVIPNRRSVFTELNTPTRIFEYLSQGRPIIAPRAPGILDYFGPEDLVYFELGSVDDLARQIEFVYREPAAVQAIVERGQVVYRNRRWSRERGRFLQLVSTLLGLEERPVDVSPPANRALVQGGP